MKGLRIASIMLFTYIGLLITNTMLYLSWSDDTGELPSTMIRVVVIAIVAYGLWTSKPWAWSLGLVSSIFFGLVAVVGAAILSVAGANEEWPYATADFLLMSASAVVLIGAVIVLLLPTTRKAVGNHRKGS